MTAMLDRLADIEWFRRAWFRLLWRRAKRAARSGLHRGWIDIARGEFSGWNRTMFIRAISGPECVTLDQMCWPGRVRT